MIPEQYGQVVRRWLWLIVACIVVGGLAGLCAAPSFSGSTSSFTSNVTLVTSRYVSFSRIVTAGEANFDDGVIGDYTTSLVTYAGTPHFAARLQDALAEQGLRLSAGDVKRRVIITAVPTLFRIEIEASGTTKEQAETIASTAADVLSTKAKTDEDDVASQLTATLEEQRNDLTDRVRVLKKERDGLERGARGRDPYIVDLEFRAASEQLRELTNQRDHLLLARSSSNPVVQVRAPETVETHQDAMPQRDLLLLGALAGLVAGWVLANVAERLVPSPVPATTLPPAPAPDRPRLPVETVAMNDRLRGMLARVAQLEQRARALRDYTTGTQPGHGGR
ncbi:MAG: hypothetical protein HY723_01870 [Chloroflexi bacterium]|nr:hypothetical protein [Chloroflexota bacterium]